jgi:transposase InsO family protein
VCVLLKSFCQEKGLRCPSSLLLILIPGLPLPGTKSKASLAAKEFFAYARLVFPYPLIHILSDNGSEFAKHFAKEVRRLCIRHYHIYPRRPQDNPYAERYNRTIQDEYIDYHTWELGEPNIFNQGLMKYLLWYNTERPHWSLNLQSPVQFIIKQEGKKSKVGWTDTSS